MLLAGQALAQPATVVLDPLIDWKNPMGLTLEKVQQLYAVQPALRSNNWLKISRGTAKGEEPYATAILKEEPDAFVMKLGARSLPVSFFRASFSGIKLTSASFSFGMASLTDAAFGEKFIQEVRSLGAWDEPVFSTLQRTFYLFDQAAKRQVNTDVTEEQWMWKRDSWYARLSRSQRLGKPWSPWSFSFGNNDSLPGGKIVPSPAEQPPELAEEVTQPRPTVELKADLDPLLDFTNIWQTTADQFAKRYVARVLDGEQREPPQFEWLTAAKDRARFSRQMFVDAPTTLTIFGGAVKVEEAVVEFVTGKAGRATISIYNRGDAGQMGSPEFQALFKKVGQSLGAALKVTPRRQMSPGTGAVKNVAWMWTSPLGVALLEHNDFESQAGSGRPEYLRLKVAAPDQADWTMGRMTLGVQRMTLQKNVLRDAASGDIYVSGVPMVDQGAKGYCVAASCQRLLEYMRIPCDQHELAQLLSVDVERGANAFEMQKSLSKVDQKFGVAFKPLVNPEQYYSGGGKRRISMKEFASIIKEHADKGIPLLWALGLGQFPEDPPLPGGGQVTGGHMRMIIGYNSAKNQVIFTDSWGAGHEKKRMSAANAYEATLGLYSMSPRGL